MSKLEIYENGRKFFGNNSSSTSGIEGRYGELIMVIDGDLEVIRFFWDEAYEKLNANEKQLIEMFFPSIKDQVIRGTKTPNELLTAIYQWCSSKENLKIICSRCGGSGQFSYNHRDGTRCFKCHGNGRTFPRLSKKWIKLVAQELTQQKGAVLSPMSSPRN